MFTIATEAIRASDVYTELAPTPGNELYLEAAFALFRVVTIRMISQGAGMNADLAGPDIALVQQPAARLEKRAKDELKYFSACGHTSFLPPASRAAQEGSIAKMDLN